MSTTIDARGLSCPQPVILTKKVMDEKKGQEITTIVDNEAARENVSKLASSQGYSFTVESRRHESYIRMVPGQSDVAIVHGQCESEDSAGLERELVILVKSQYFGEGDPELGALLIKSWAYALTEMSAKLQAIIFMNGGVHLTTEGSPVLEHLSVLEDRGVQLLSCGTCLDFFAKKEQLRVGQVTNMYTAMDLLSNAAQRLVI